MRRLRLAIIGFGRLGRACAGALREAHDLELAGVVRREPVRPLPPPFTGTPVAALVRELPRVDAALVCVPALEVLGVGRALAQQGVPLVECAILEERALAAHHSALAAAARQHRVPAVVSAGWDPGARPLLERLFEVLIPQGRTEVRTHPGVKARHSAAAAGLPGVKAALVCEARNAEGRLQHYVYAQLEPGTSAAELERALAADPLYAGESLLVLPVNELSAFEAARGLVLERHGEAEAGAHPSLLLEARFEPHAFAAHVMLDAARRLPRLGPGAHPYSLWG